MHGVANHEITSRVPKIGHSTSKLIVAMGPKQGTWLVFCLAVACPRGSVLRVLSGPEYSRARHTSRVRYPPLHCHYACTSRMHVFLHPTTNTGRMRLDGYAVAFSYSDFLTSALSNQTRKWNQPIIYFSSNKTRRWNQHVPLERTWYYIVLGSQIKRTLDSFSFVSLWRSFPSEPCAVGCTIVYVFQRLHCSMDLDFILRNLWAGFSLNLRWK
jgi:hypothetical protein